MVWSAGYQLQGGKYIIEEVLGQGGFGITYKALHDLFNYPVVIKTPNEYLKNDPDYQKYVDRFIKEARILARISRDPHPHIVGVHDLFTESATHCLVMDFVSGENLFELVKRRGALPEAEIVRYVRQIGEALAQVHQAGLVHRDAHPGNIMLRGNGKAVLIDFGIAKELVPSTQSSSKGIAGNQGFAPYEQMVRGSREPAVDVYCLAATLYYAVTGQRPSTSLDRKLNKVALTPPNRIVPGISNRLNQAILKGMALEAKDRPQSMDEWLKLLTPTAPSTRKTFISQSKFWLSILFLRRWSGFTWVTICLIVVPIILAILPGFPSINMYFFLFLGFSIWLIYMFFLILAIFFFIVKRNYKQILATIISIFVLIVPVIFTRLIFQFRLIFETRYITGISNSEKLHISNSSELQDNDEIIVDKIHYKFHNPSRKDIILFAPPESLKEFYKKHKEYYKESDYKPDPETPNFSRVIGLPGEKVELKGEGVYINDQLLQENYVEEPAKYGYWSVTVPPDSYLVLKDNRKSLVPDDNGNLIHFWGGVVPRDHIIGRVVGKFSPPERVGEIE